MEGKRHITVALRTLLKPIVKLLIELGFSSRDFNEITKLVYVEVASNDYGIKGRKTNMSRVAIMTGLTRREVARLRKVIEHDLAHLKTPNSVAGKVLAAWHQEEQYLDDLGRPRLLRVEGADSLTELIDRFRGDIPSTALVKELERVEAISMRGNHARALARFYMPFTLDARSIERFGSVLYDVANTITHNLVSNSVGSAWFEGRASNERVSLHANDAFKHFLDRHAQSFLEEVDDWLKDHEADCSQEEGIRLGIGVYAIANDKAQNDA